MYAKPLLSESSQAAVRVGESPADDFMTADRELANATGLLGQKEEI